MKVKDLAEYLRQENPEAEVHIVSRWHQPLPLPKKLIHASLDGSRYAEFEVDLEVGAPEFWNRKHAGWLIL